LKQFVVKALKLPLRVAQIVPVFGLMFVSGLTAVLATRLFRNKKKTKSDKFLEALFLVSITSIMAMAYVFWLMKASHMPRVSAVFFVVAALIEFLRDLARGLKLYFDYKNRPGLDEGDPKKTLQAKFIRKMEYQKALNNAIINTSASLVLVGLSAMLSFLPGSIPLIVGFVLGMVLTHLVKKLLNDWNKRINARELSEGLGAIEVHMPYAPTPSKTQTPQSYPQSPQSKRGLAFFSPAPATPDKPNRFEPTHPLNLN
jgi:hypothetical protein